jgi:hypothetical protein
MEDIKLNFKRMLFRRKNHIIKIVWAVFRIIFGEATMRGQ